MTPRNHTGLCAGPSAFRSDSPEDDDDDGIAPAHPRNNAAAAAAAKAAAAAATGSSVEATVAAAVAKLPATPRLRTRLFAAELLLLLFAAVGPDSRHRHPQPKYVDTAAAGRTGGVSRGFARTQQHMHMTPRIRGSRE
jgi:hypothetical protein